MVDQQVAVQVMHISWRIWTFARTSSGCTRMLAWLLDVKTVAVRPTVEVPALGWRGTGAHAALGAVSAGRTIFGLTLGPGCVCGHADPKGTRDLTGLLARGLVGLGHVGRVGE